jgi:hypothetical protein
MSRAHLASRSSRPAIYAAIDLMRKTRWAVQRAGPPGKPLNQQAEEIIKEKKVEG